MSNSGLADDRVAAPDRLEDFLVGPTGLRISRTPAFDEWVQAGARLGRVTESFCWCLGDWLVFGQRRYPERYRAAVDQAGLDHQTLRNYASVARRVAPERRRPALSFQHHAEVAGLEDGQQESWLAEAERRQWSRNQLRQHLQAARAHAGRRGHTVPAAPARLEVAPERAERWRRAAEHSQEHLRSWMLDALDRAAAAQLEA